MLGKLAPILRAPVAATLFCLGMSALSAPSPANAQAPPPESGAPTGDDQDRAAILELKDTALIAAAWRALFADSSGPPAGEYVALIPSVPGASDGSHPGSSVHLLRNGTELGRFDRAVWDAILSDASAGRRKWAAVLEGPEKQDVPLVWEAGKWDGPALLEKAEWPEGFAFGIGSTFSAVRSSKPQYQREFEFAWNQKAFSHFLLGASLHRSQYGGGLTRLGQEVADTAGGRLAPLSYNPFWGDGYWWWTFSAGVPGLRYTLALADQPLPRYFWLESRASEAIRTHSQGRLVSQWQGSKLESSGNLSQSIDARYGIFRYGILLDFDAYRVPVQTMGCEDLPALFGTWGAGLILASDVLATRVWLDIPDAALSLDVPRDWPTRVRIAFLRLEFDYRNQKSFSLGLSVRLNVQNPIMNLPRTRS